MRVLLLSWAVLFCISAKAQSPSFQFTNQYTATGLSLRGLCIVNEQIVWASGTAGTVLRTLNGGKDWQKIMLKGYEKLDFRDIHAFDSLRAIIINAGSPAHVLCTADGGKTWTIAYQNLHKKAFLDDLAFANEQQGIVFGDPDSTGKFLTLRTTDAGKTWRAEYNFFPTPEGQEAGFAASGSILQAIENKVWLATGGGKKSRLFYSKDMGKNWEIQETPILCGKEAQGIFSLALGSSKAWVAVGGDYTRETNPEKASVYTLNAGKIWKVSTTPPRGYRSGIAHAAGKVFVCVGTSGSDMSMNNGKTWQPINTLDLNAVRFDKKGKIGWAVGRDGQIYKISR